MFAIHFPSFSTQRALRLAIALLGLLLFSSSLSATCTSAGTILLPNNLTAWDYATWGGTASNPIACDVVIPSGHSVFLSNEHLYFAPGKQITVGGGGTLVAFRCTFEAQNLTSTWQGIQIVGNKTLPPTDPAQGHLFLKESTLINPVSGVVCGGPWPSVIGGGILVAVDNTFINPENYAIEIYDYGYPNASRIRRNTFRSDQEKSGFWGFIKLDVVINVLIEDNEFYNTHAPSTLGTSGRGTGIYAGSSTFLAKGNDFYRLSYGIFDRKNVTSATYQNDPLANPTRIVRNNFYNNRRGVAITKTRKAYVDQNTFVVNDNNIQTINHLNTGGLHENRAFSGVVLNDFYETVDEVTVANNDFIVDINTQLANAEPLNCFGVTITGYTHATQYWVHDNRFDYKMPLPDTYPSGSLVGVRNYRQGQFYIECNTFDFDGNSPRVQKGIAWADRTNLTAIGTPNHGAGNQFLNFANCGSNQHALFGDAAYIAPYVHYYELVGSANYLPANCSPDITVFDITGSGGASGCSFPGPPAVIPGSISNPPALPPYPSSKASLTPEAVEFAAFPSRSHAGPIRVRLPAVAGQLRLLGMNGQILQEVAVAADTQQLELDLSHYAAGIYLLSFTSDQQNHHQKIILY